MKWLIAAALATAASAATAQSFSSKPVKIIVPVTPGSATDTMARPEDVFMSPAQFESFRREEHRGLGHVTRAAGVKAR